MTYADLLAKARKLGLAIKGRPKKNEVEKKVREEEARRAAQNDPDTLHAVARTLRAKSQELESEAKVAEDRANTITSAKAKVAEAEKALYLSLVMLRDAGRALVGLGLAYKNPAGRLKNGKLYRFTLDGSTYEETAIVLADSFAEAKAKAIAGDIVEGDRPEMEPEDLAELQKALDALKENGKVEHADHVLTTETIMWR